MRQLSFEHARIDGFRGLRDLSLDGLGLLNILVGANNSGKTSVLEAFSILCNPYEPHEWLEMIRRRDFGGLDETRIQSLRWCFRQTGDATDPYAIFESECELRCHGSFPLRRLLARYRDIIGEPTERDLERLARQRFRGREIFDQDEPWRGAEISHFVDVDATPGQPELFAFDDEPVVIQLWEHDRLIRRPPRRRGNLPADTLTPYSYQINRLQVGSHSRQFLAGTDGPAHGKQMLLDLVREFDSEVSDVEVASFRGHRPAIYVNHRRLGFAPLSIFGDAFRRAVLLASTLQSLRGGGLLLIDEIETGIHVSSLQRVFAWLAEAARFLNVQVVATTHSLEAVDAIIEACSGQIEDLVTYHLDQSKEQTRAKRIAGEMLLRLRRERGLDVR